MKKLIILIVLILIGFLLFSVFNKDVEAPSTTDKTTEETNNEENLKENANSGGSNEVSNPPVEEDTGMVISATLKDVTGGNDVRGINTGGNASGEATAKYKGSYELLVTFSGLPDPVGDDFYEGWIVKREGGKPVSVISTGKVQKVGGSYVNQFSDSRNLLENDFYVLTIEPNDGDPAPADHIVEEVMK